MLAVIDRMSPFHPPEHLRHTAFAAAGKDLPLYTNCRGEEAASPFPGEKHSTINAADFVPPHRTGSFFFPLKQRSQPRCRSPPASEIEIIGPISEEQEDCPMAEKYIIRVQGELVEVTEEVYRAYHGIERRLLTLDEKDERNGKTLYSDLDTAEILGEEMIPDLDAVSVEDAAITLVLHDQLQRALSLLAPPERKLIDEIYFKDLSERQVSKQSGVPYMTIHNRKVRILKKLARIMK